MKKLFAILCVLLSVAVAQAQIVKFPAGAPTMGTCGTSPSVSGNNSIGTITVGAGVVTSCALNFSQTFATAPICIIGINSSVMTFGVATTTAVMTITLSATLGGGTIFYICGLP